MTPDEFFSAYTEEIWKTRYSISKDVKITQERVGEIYLERLGELIDRLFPQGNLPQEVKIQYRETKEVIKAWTPSKTTNEKIKRHLLHLFEVEKKKKPYLLINDIIARNLVEYVKYFDRAMETRDSDKTEEDSEPVPVPEPEPEPEHVPLPNPEQLPKQNEEPIKEETPKQRPAIKEEGTSYKQLEKTIKKLVKKANEGQLPRISSQGRRGGRPVRVVEKKSDTLSFKMEDLLKFDPNLKEKLEKFLEKNKAGQFYIPALKRSVYISRANLNKLKVALEEKKGGFLTLIPILAGIAAAGSVAGGAAGIAQAVNKKKAEDAALAEQHRHNISLEDAERGKGLKDDVVKFVQDNDIDDNLKRVVKKTLKGLATVIPMRKEGGSLILDPYRKNGAH